MTGKELGIGQGAVQQRRAFVKTPYFCPYCGHQTMWHEAGDTVGDYYLGVATWCATCKQVTSNLDYPVTVEQP